MKSRKASSSTSVFLSRKIAYAGAVLTSNFRESRGRRDFSGLKRDIDQYGHALLQYSNKELASAKSLEIGFGQRPARVFALASLGIDVVGVDLEHPTLVSADFARVFLSNGAYRALKGFVRLLALDRAYYRDLEHFMRETYGCELQADRNRLVVADSSSDSFWQKFSDGFDFIFSEDVFEHIPRESLARVVSSMANGLRDDGIAFVRPMVFTGICGGHHIDWYSGTFKSNTKRRTPAWDHLQKNSYEADTYLNKLSRREYVDLFSKYFDILEDTAELGRLGEEFLTPQLRQELSSWDDYELFSNNVTFVLRKRRV